MNAKIDRGVRIERKAREIEAKPPIENIVEGEIAIVAQAVRA